MTTCPHCHAPYAATSAQAIVVHLRACPRATLAGRLAAIAAAYAELLAEMGVEG